MRRQTTEPAVHHEITQLIDNYHFRDVKGTTVLSEIDSEQCQGPLYHEFACRACRDIEAYAVAFERHWQNIILGLGEVPAKCVSKVIKEDSLGETIRSHRVHWPDLSCEPSYRGIQGFRDVANLTTIEEEEESEDTADDHDETIDALCSFKDYLRGMRDEEQRKIKDLKTRLEDLSNNTVSFDLPRTLRLAAEGNLLMTGRFKMKPSLVPKEHRVLLKHIISQVQIICSGESKSGIVKMAVIKISQGLSETLKLMTLRRTIEKEIMTYKEAKPRESLCPPMNDLNKEEATLEHNPASQDVEEGTERKTEPVSATCSNTTSEERKVNLIKTRHVDRNGGLETDKVKVTRASVKGTKQCPRPDLPQEEVRTGRMTGRRASSPKAVYVRGTVSGGKVHEMIKFWESVNTQDDDCTGDRNWQTRPDLTQAGRPPPQTDTETSTPRDTGQQTHKQIYNTRTNVLTRPPEKEKEKGLANRRNGDRQELGLKYVYNIDNFRDIKDTMTHNGEDSASHRGPGPYRLTFQVPDLLESDDDGSVNLGPRHVAPAPVSIWAPGQLGSGHFRTIFQVPDLIESDNDCSIAYGPLNEAMSSQLSLHRGYSQADSSAEYLAAIAEQYEAVEAGLDLCRDIRLTYRENRCSTPTRVNIRDTEDMDYWNAHGYNEASNIGGPVDTASDLPPQPPFTFSNITTSLVDPHAYTTGPEEIDERAPSYNPNGDESYSGTRAQADLASLAIQLPEYRSWNHDDIQLHEDADNRIRDPESEHEHRDDNPWYLEKDLWGDRGISVFDDTASLGDEGEGGNDSGCLV